MRLKAVLLLAFYFVGIHCARHKKNNENKDDKIIAAEQVEKAKQIFSEIDHVENENIKTLLKYVKNFSLENLGLMVEQLSKVKDAATELYQPYEEEFEGIHPIKNEESINQNFLNRILGNLLEGVENGSQVDEGTMSDAISILKYFIYYFEIPSTRDSKTNEKTGTHSFKSTPLRRKRENGCPTAKRHRCIIGSALGIVVAVVILVILWTKNVIHISPFN
ncbi:unnamed protein product [Meloidogyne enterolobii]|uniref:Uncharacterized protein n=1 Tax=Meloidogyne enterolobii TaxID=390850 RepID=A0ACB1AAX7_MELEN